MTRAGTLILLMVLPGVAAAQLARPTATACPARNGLFVSVSSGDSAARADSTRSPQTSARTTIDTTWRFDIANRRWTWRYFSAVIGAGWSSPSATTGTTTAPQRAPEPSAAAWNACVGAAIGMQDPTLVLRGARGQVHLRVDLSALTRAGQRTDTTSRPRRPE